MALNFIDASGHRWFRVRASFWFYVFTIVILVGMAFILFKINILLGQVDFNSKLLLEHSKKIMAVERAVPETARYYRVFRAVSERAGQKLTMAEASDVTSEIIKACQLASDVGVDPAMVLALITVESGFNPRAVSDKRAYGLMQCLRSTFEIHSRTFGLSGFSEAIAFSPKINVGVGCAELVRLRRLYMAEGISDWMIPLTGYNWGEAAGWSVMTPGNPRHVDLAFGRLVLRMMEKFKKEYGL